MILKENSQIEKINILLVDDKKENLFSIEALLEESDRNFLKAISGEEALKLALNNEIALILLDVKMPDMSGFEVAKILQSSPKTKYIPILFITASSMDSINMLQGYKEGGIDYLFKPLEPEITKAKVSSFVKFYKQQKELALAKRELTLKTDELERSNKELEQFAYVASHDLQEPLRTISSYLQLLERRSKDKLDNDALEFLEFAIDGAQRMHALIQDLLTYSRVTSTTLSNNEVNCNTILTTVVNNLKESIQKNKASITFDLLPSLKADKFQMLQLFQNLISNAIKFHREDSSPIVHVSAEELAIGNSNYWQFAVKDNGIGIDKKYSNKIFGLFQRLHGKGKYNGTGIGLSICKKIVESHGGKIWFDSELNKGSTFYFTLKKEE